MTPPDKQENELRPCTHDPIKMCDPCCTCSRLEVKSLKEIIDQDKQKIEELTKAIESWKKEELMWNEFQKEDKQAIKELVEALIRLKNEFHQLKYMESTPGIEFVLDVLASERKATLELPEIQEMAETLKVIKETCHGDAVVYARVALANFTRLKDSMK